MPMLMLPNGESVDVPHDAPPELLGRLRQYHDSLLVKQETIPTQESTQEPSIDFDSMLGKAKTVGREGLSILDSAVKGTMAIPKTVVDLGAGISELGDKHLPEWAKVPGATEALRKISGVLTPIPATTKTGKQLSNVASSVTSSMAAPGSRVVNAAIGTGAGVGGETAATVFGDNPVSRILGSLIGGGVAGFKTAPKGNESALAKEAIEGLSKNQLDDAVKIMTAAKSQGIPLNLSQALDVPSNVDPYISTLAQSAQGKQTAKLLREQPLRVQEEAKRQLNTLPGKITDSTTAARDVIDASKTRLKGLEGERSEQWVQARDKARLNAPKEATGEEITNSLTSIRKLQEKYTPRDTEHKMLGELHARLFNDGNMLVDPDKIHRTLKGFKEDVKSSDNKSAAKYVSGIANDLSENIGAMKPYREADRAFNEFSNVVINPLKRTVVGTLAQGKSTSATTEAKSGILEQVFRKGTQEGGNSRIMKLAEEGKLAGKPEAFINAAKSYFANRADEAFRSVDNRVNPDSAGNLRKALGTELQLDHIARGTGDILEGLAHSHGIKDTKAFGRGFKEFMNTVARASNRPGTVSGTNMNDITEKAGDHLLKRTGQFSIITPLRQPILWWSEKLKSDSLGTMDRLLNSPEGVAMLVKLGREPRMSHKAQTAITTYIATQAQLNNNAVQSKE